MDSSCSCGRGSGDGEQPAPPTASRKGRGGCEPHRSASSRRRQRQRQVRRRDHHPAACRDAPPAWRRSARPTRASSPSVGSSSSHSGAARQRQPRQRQPPPLSGRQHARRQVGQFRQAHRRQRLATAPPRSRAAKPQVLRRRQPRLHRVLMPDIGHPRAHATAGRPAHPRRPTAARPAAGRSSPASSRSSVDLARPVRPGQQQRAARRHGEVEVAEHQPLAAERRQTLPPAARPLPPPCGRSPAGVV